MERSMSFFTQSFLEFIQDIVYDTLNHLGYFVAHQFEAAIEINQIPAVANVALFSTLLGAALCTLMVGKQVIGTYGFGTKGDPDQDAMEILFRLSLALGAMGINSWLFTELSGFTLAVARDVITSIGGSLNGDSVIEGLIANEENPDTVMTFFGCGLVVGLILFTISVYLRAAEITLSKILLPIFALDLLNTNPEKWNMFLFQYVIGFMGYIVQMLCFQIFTYQLLRLDSLAPGNLMLLIAWLVLSIKTPKWLEKYIYATGTGQAIGRGASRLGQVVMFVGLRR